MFNNQHTKFLQPLTIGFYGWWHSTPAHCWMDLTWTEGWPGCLRARAGIQEARCEQRTYLKPSEVQELGVQSKPNFTEQKARHRGDEVLTADRKSQRPTPQRRCRAELTWGQNFVGQRAKRMIWEQVRRFLECKRNSERWCSSHLLMNALDNHSWALRNHYGALHIDKVLV